MLKVILARLQQGHRTMEYPDGPLPELPDRFRGRPTIDVAKCPNGCRDCAEVCPTAAISLTGAACIDLGRCLFCTACAMACPEQAIAYSRDHRMAVRQRGDLSSEKDQPELRLAAALDSRLKRLFGRSLKLRQVSAGGCNACEADVNVLSTIGWDLGRFGIQFVASPRHADGLLITGPVPRNMELALRKTYEALPEPKIVIAVGACAISGGPYIDLPQVNNGAEALVPVDLYIPGCPPHPLTILDGLLRLLGRIEDRVPRPERETQPRVAPAPAGEVESTCADERGLMAGARRWWRRLQPVVEEYLGKNHDEQPYSAAHRPEDDRPER